MRNKHWTSHLPEAGTIEKRGQSQFALLDKIDALSEQIKILNAEYNQAEEELNKLAITQWSDEEIAKAKENAKI